MKPKLKNKNFKFEEKIKIKKYLTALDRIEKARKQNNVNWMDILRIALKNAPNETIKLMKKINKKDQIITNLFKSIK
tara:strand:+ start:1102 stop:1332 length:231 start_codon:yes stop_codon:yes gene_type:complete